jgi:hypothetical protein
VLADSQGPYLIDNLSSVFVINLPISRSENKFTEIGLEVAFMEFYNLLKDTIDLNQVRIQYTLVQDFEDLSPCVTDNYVA